jgi:hypothetical protein
MAQCAEYFAHLHRAYVFPAIAYAKQMAQRGTLSYDPDALRVNMKFAPDFTAQVKALRGVLGEGGQP